MPSSQLRVYDLIPHNHMHMVHEKSKMKIKVIVLSIICEQMIHDKNKVSVHMQSYDSKLQFKNQKTTPYALSPAEEDKRN